MNYRTVQLINGKFDVQDEQGNSVLDSFGGPYYTIEAAQATERMLTSFDAVDAQIAGINESLRAVA